MSVLSVLLIVSRVDADITSYMVDTAESRSNIRENSLYGSPVIWSLDINPATTNWIAWNDQATTHVIGGDEYVGMNSWIGTDDFFILTVTNPVGDTKSVIMDYNYFIAKSVGTQAVIYGQADTAPNVHRWYTGYGYNLTSPWTGDPNDPIPGLSWDGGGEYTRHSYFDEDGAFNDIFTESGVYDFSMVYGNSGNQYTYHPDMYILVDGETPVVPEPASLTLWSLFGLAFAGLFWWRRR